MHPAPSRQRLWTTCAAAAFCLATSASALAAEPLRWKFSAGDQHKYKMTQEMEMSMDIPGVGPTAMSISQIMDMTWDVQKVNDQGDAVISQTIERARVKIEAPGQSAQYDTASDEPPVGMATMMAPTLKALTQGPTEMTMTPRGKVIEIKVDPELVKAMQAAPGAAMMGEMASEEGLKNMARQASVELPEKLAVGDQWSTKFEIVNPMAGGKVSVVTNYVYQGPTEVEGATLEQITPSLTMSFGGGEGENQPQLKVENQESTGEILFNRDAGLLQTSTLEQDMDIVVTVPGGETMSQKMKQTVKLQLVDEHEKAQ